MVKCKILCFLVFILPTYSNSLNLWPQAEKVPCVEIWCDLGSVGADGQNLQQPLLLLNSRHLQRILQLIKVI